MKVAIYVRVSTDKQEVDNQLSQLRDYAGKCKYEICQEYIDIISGKETNRPGYDAMFKDAYQKKFDIILFWDLSRFSRAGTLYTLQKLKELENLGIDWESYQERYFRSAGQFKDVVLSVVATVAKMEREKISARTLAGLERIKKRIAKKGKYTTKGGKLIKRLGRPGISSFQVNKAKELYAELGSINAVSKKMNLSYGSVYNIVKLKKMDK